jgi:EAL domain-containing protein (putative c-di-GMP-specific phosphodiesterase class I)
VTWIDERIAADLPGAVDRGELYVLYQPQIDLASGEIVAVEALCRWQHPELGLLMPSTFIPIAESSGRIDGVSVYMVGEALDAADRWRSAGHPLEMSVNVSPVLLAVAAFHELVADEVQRRALPAHALTLEITESLPVLDIPEVVASLQKLRDSGLGVSLDDYGSGHSSLAQFESLPATELKLDRSIVQDAGPAAIAQIDEIVVLAHDRGMLVVAEGVETVAQLERMRSAGCDRAQGYLLGMPMPRAELDLVFAA